MRLIPAFGRLCLTACVAAFLPPAQVRGGGDDNAIRTAPAGANTSGTFAAPQPPAPQREFARVVFRELIGIDTGTATGDTGRAADAMSARLLAAGYPEGDVQVFKPGPRKGNLVARLHGLGAGKPILLLAHLDVVPARREDWSFDPFTLTERDGWFYGRGTVDDKHMAAAFVATLVRIRQEGFRPDRDIILVLSTDEEARSPGGPYGIEWLLQNHRDLIEAEFALNEGGGIARKDGRVVTNSFQTCEKTGWTVRIEVKNPGGHSSLPTKDNAIYRLAAGLGRLAAFEFPVHLNETTRAYFERAAALESGQVAADLRAVAQPTPDPAAVARLAEIPFYNAQLRTTAVATRIEAGHANNALPQTAVATINCRILPGETAETVRQTLIRVLADGQIAVGPAQPTEAIQPSPLQPGLLATVERLTAEFWPGTPVIPTMCTGATDGRHLRRAGIPTYGTDGFVTELLDPRAHARDERIGVDEFYTGVEYTYLLVKALTGGSLKAPLNSN